MGTHSISLLLLLISCIAYTSYGQKEPLQLFEKEKCSGCQAIADYVRDHPKVQSCKDLQPFVDEIIKDNCGGIPFCANYINSFCEEAFPIIVNNIDYPTEEICWVYCSAAKINYEQVFQGRQEQRQQPFKYYRDWTAIQVVNNMKSALSLREVEISWGKYYDCVNKDHKVDFVTSYIPAGKDDTFCAVGASGWPSGTEGKVTFYDGTTSIGILHFDVPSSSSNVLEFAYATEYAKSLYIVTLPSYSQSGSLGHQTIYVSKASTLAEKEAKYYQSGAQLKYWKDWVKIITVNNLGKTLKIKNAQLSYGHYYDCFDKNTEPDFTTATIEAGDTHQFCAVGKGGWPSGTEGYIDYFEGLTKIGTLYFDVPNSASNVLTFNTWNSNYVVDIPTYSTEGALGDVTIKVSRSKQRSDL